MSRSTVKYLALLALAVTLFYWKTLLTDQFTVILGYEGVDQAYAWLHIWVRSVWGGHVPLWDPYAYGGRPFTGEMPGYDPLHLLFALVPLNRNGMVSPRFFHQFLGLIHLLCAYFMFALLRELKCSSFAAFIGAVAFSLGGFLSRMMWPVYIESCIWLPAIFLFLLRALRAKMRAQALMEAALAGLSLGLSILAGGLGFFILQSIVVVSAVLYHGAASLPAGSRNRRSHWMSAALILATVLAVAGGTGAVQLLPGAEYSGQTLRFIDGGTIDSAVKIPFHRLVPGMWPQSILTGLFPNAFNSVVAGEEYLPFYIGVLPLFLAVITIWRRWCDLWVRYLTALAVLAFAYSLGEFSPLYGILYAVVPYLWIQRAPNRFLYLISFALAILAAFGFDVLEASVNEPWWAPARSILKWLAIVCGAALFVPGIFTQISINSWNAFSLLLILTACGCLARLTRHPPGRWLPVALAAFVLFDLGAFEWLERDKNAADKPAASLDQMISLRAAADFIKSRPGLNRVRVGVSPEPNIGDVYGIQSIWGGGATVLREYAGLGYRDNLMNVRYLIKPAAAPDPNPIYHDARWKIYENPGAFPRGWLVHQAVVEPSGDAVFRRLDDPSIDLHKVAVLDAPLAQPLGDPAGAAESVRFLSYEPDRMAIEVKSAKPALLVLSEFHYPGWQATVNGKPAAIYKADGALRAIWAPEGASRIELNYRPASFLVGGALTLLTVLGVASGLFVSWRKGVWSLLATSLG